MHVALEDGTEIVKGVDLAVNMDEVHAVMGPNGSGKSTLAYALMGHPAYEVTEGDVLFEGRKIGGLPAWRVAQGGIGRTSQNIRLFKEMTALDNVRTPAAFRAPYGLVGWMRQR